MQWPRWGPTNAHQGWWRERASPRQGTPGGATCAAGVASQRGPAARSQSCVACPACGLLSCGGQARTWDCPGQTRSGVMAACAERGWPVLSGRVSQWWPCMPWDAQALVPSRATNRGAPRVRKGATLWGGARRAQTSTHPGSRAVGGLGSRRVRRGFSQGICAPLHRGGAFCWPLCGCQGRGESTTDGAGVKKMPQAP